MRNPRIAVLLMAYGAAASPEDVPAYLADILGGRPADPALVEEVRRRYKLMGGKSPLLEITRAQAAGLAARLNEERHPGDFYVLFGMRHSMPTILDAVRAIAQEGSGTVVAMPLTPYYSAMSVGAYMKKYQEALRQARLGVQTVAVGSWHDHPRLIKALAGKVREALNRFPENERKDVKVLFTAHSLPERILKEGDPYQDELAATAKAVAAAAGISGYSFAYQSAGRTGGPWLGPEAGEEIDRLDAAGCRRLVLAPIGFVSDHMETLYDDDILYRRQAEAKGMRLERAASLNADPVFLDAMADVVRARLTKG